MISSIKNIKATLVIAATVMIGMMACSEKIDLELDGMEPRLVIDARITDLSEGNRVLITKSTGYNAGNPPPPITGAVVRLSAGKSMWQLKETETGEYMLPGYFRGEAPNVYTIEVETDKETVYAVSEMKEAIQLDSITVRPHPWFSDRQELLVHFQDPPGQLNYYMWKVYKNGVLLTDTMRRVPFADSEIFSGQYVRFPVYMLQSEDSILNPGDTIRVDQYRITEEYFNFLVATRRNRGAAGGPFVGPPANIPSNFSNNALGFFMTASVSSSSLPI